MILRSLDVDKGFFRHQENDEELIGLKVPYLSVIGAVMHLANYIRPDIAFAINLLNKI